MAKGHVSPGTTCRTPLIGKALSTRSSARDGLSGSPPADSEICRRREGLPRRRAAQGRADELPAETVRVCRLRVVVAFDRVGHRLSDAMSGLEAAQKTFPVIGHSAADTPGQFRGCAWYAGQNHYYSGFLF